MVNNTFRLAFDSAQDMSASSGFASSLNGHTTRINNGLVLFCFASPVSCLNVPAPIRYSVGNQP